MGHKVFYVALVVAALVSACSLAAEDDLLSELDSFNPIQLNSANSNDNNQLVTRVCKGWRLSVETNNHQSWETVPKLCADYIEEYMTGGQYDIDLNVTVAVAMRYLKTLKASKDDIWVFDLDETMLSDLQYYSQKPDPDFGVEPYNKTKFHEWIAKGNLTAIVAVRRLYNAVLKAGFKIAIISGTPERFRLIRIANLLREGYSGWHKLVLRPRSASGIPAADFKSSEQWELIRDGFSIIGNIGDQWSDLRDPRGNEYSKRTFKVPNPMYYVE